MMAYLAHLDKMKVTLDDHDRKIWRRMDSNPLRLIQGKETKNPKVKDHVFRMIWKNLVIHEISLKRHQGS